MLLFIFLRQSEDSVYKHLRAVDEGQENTLLCHTSNKTRVGDCEVARHSVNVYVWSPLQLLEQVDAKWSHHFPFSLKILNYHSYNINQNYEASLFTVIIQCRSIVKIVNNFSVYITST